MNELPELPDAEPESDGLSAYVFTPPDYQTALEWMAVLGAADIDARVRRHPVEGWQIAVMPQDYERACREIGAFRQETRYWPPAWSRPGEERQVISLPSIVVAIALIAFHLLLTGPFDETVTWFAVGAADAHLILAGEWWRTVTALCLHSDFDHVASNAICLALLGGVVCRRLGEGLGWLTVLLSGVLGNVATALAFRQDHLSVGASTSVFGALGILAGVTLMDYLRRRGPINWRGVGVPVVVMIAFFAFLGISPGTDVMAHLTGTVCGFLLGLGAGPFVERRDHPTLQFGLGVAALLLTALSWGLALRG